MTVADKINLFNSRLSFNQKLPDGIRIMNPFKENKAILSVTQEFYKKYYNDIRERYLILGINPGRHGAGLTGIPFTDTVRLEKYCKIQINEFRSYETSSEFIYNMIKRYGGVKKFYSRYYINAVCPLGFTREGKHGNQVNYNYYDDKELLNAVYGFIVKSLKEQIAFGMNTSICYCLGTGKNYKFLIDLNNSENLFGKIIALEHPRYIMQYRRKKLQNYIDKYISVLK
jgi:hypothetical protein